MSQVVSVNQLLAQYEAKQKDLFDQLCDFTSISGFRFVHSRHPYWFRVLSAAILFGSIGMFAYHAYNFIRKYAAPQAPMTLTTKNAKQFDPPYIIVCPMQQFRSLSNFENGTRDFAHIVSKFYVSGAYPPSINDTKLGTIMQTAIADAQFMTDIKDLQTVRVRADEFRKYYADVFPECALLLHFDQALRFHKDSNSVFDNFSNYDQWPMQDDPCYRTQLGPLNDSDTHESFVRCRVAKVMRLLTETQGLILGFHDKLRAFQRGIDKSILLCRWYDWGKCNISTLPSASGINCFAITGAKKLKLNYITMKNSVYVVIDTFAFDNPVSKLRRKDLNVHLASNLGDDLESMARGEAYSLNAGNHMSVDIKYVKKKLVGVCSETSSDEEDPLNESPDSSNCSILSYQSDIIYTKLRYQTTPARIPDEERAARNEQVRTMSGIIQKLRNDAFQPETYDRLRAVAEQYYDGHQQLLGALNISMRSFLEANLQSHLPPKTNVCSEVPRYHAFRLDLYRVITDHWQREHEPVSAGTAASFSRTIQLRLSVSPIYLNTYYGNKNNETQMKDQFAALKLYTNTLYRKLLGFRSSVSASSARTEECKATFTALKNLAYNHPLVQRVSFDPEISVFMREVEEILETRAAQSMHGVYEQ